MTFALTLLLTFTIPFAFFLFAGFPLSLLVSLLFTGLTLQCLPFLYLLLGQLLLALATGFILFLLTLILFFPLLISTLDLLLRGLL